MNIIAVDDEKLALNALQAKLTEVVPEGRLTCFGVAQDALEYARQTQVDIAFLDIEMIDMSGLELAVRLKHIHPETNIIFVTAYADYMGNALSMHVSGYILKPTTRESIQAELENLRHPVADSTSQHVHIKCFGAFEVYVDGNAFMLGRSKSMELLAYLVDRRGNGVSAAEIGAVLWPDREYTRSVQKQVQTVISVLMKALKDVDADDIIVKRRNFIALDVEKVDCDYYKFLQGDTASLNAYSGEYMSNYLWAEITTSQLFYLRLHKS